MANIQGQKKWSDVRLLETHELARGGINGNLNEQAKALADRTELLMDEKASKQEVVQGVYEFVTYAEFNAAKSNLPINCTVVIGESNNTGTGTWGIGNNSWNGSSLVKSTFDPLVMGKEYTDTRIDFIDNMPDDSKFIRELYVTGWNGTDELYLMNFNANDSGKVTFRIENKTTGNLVVYNYQKVQGLAIYPLETEGAAAGSGYGGYVAIDWTKYSEAINAQGGYKYKLNSRAKSLTACPFIAAYMNNATNTSSIQANTLDIGNLKTNVDGLRQNINFVLNVPENNQFIRELYVTGWNGTDQLYLKYFNGNDNGKVTFKIDNKTTGANVVYTYQLSKGLVVYPLQTAGTAAGSGFGGYVVVDWALYTAVINTPSQYVYEISKKALTLASCPYLQNYLNLISTNQTLAEHASKILANSNVYHRTLDASATHAASGLVNQFIPSIRLQKGHTSGFKYYISNIELVSGGVRVNIKYYDPQNPNLANPWASYNVNLIQGMNLVQTYTVQYSSYLWLITLDWNYLSQITSTTLGSGNGGDFVKTPLNMNELFKSEFNSDLATKSFPEYSYLASRVHNIVKHSNVTIWTNKPSSTVENNGYTATSNADGSLSVVGNFNPSANSAFRFDVGFSIIDLTQFYGKSLTFIAKGKVKSTNVKAAFSWGSAIQNVTVLNSPSANFVDFEIFITAEVSQWSRGPDRYPALKTSGVDIALAGSIEYQFTHFALVETQPNFVKQDYLNMLDAGALYLPSAFTTKKFKTGTWAGKKLVTLGHSIVVQNLFQPVLADLLGMQYDVNETVGTVTKQPTGIGGSHIQAVCYSNTAWNYDTHGTQDNNLKGATFFTRADWVAQYKPDLIIIFNPNNDSSDPAMVGEITDAAYTGTEEILQSAGGYPTLISTLKAIFKKLGEQNPNAKIVMCSDLLNGTAYGNADAAYNKLNGIGTANANFVARNDKLKKVCEMYGVQWIDLLHNCWDIYTMKSAFTSADTTHPILAGHEKIARYIASQL